MPVYSYASINDQARRIRGQITAANEVDLEERLKQVGLALIDFKEVKAKRSSRFGSVRLKDIIIMTLHMEQLDKAGVPLLDALADVRDATESPRLRDVLTDIFESVKGGTILSEALAKHPKVFNEVFTGLIKAGEKTGDLSSSFHHLAEHLKWVSDIKRKVKKALMYPIALTVMIIGVISTLMVFVVPKLTSFILSQGFDVPIHTRALMAVSEGFVDYWYIILSVPLIIVITLVVLYKTSEDFAYGFDAMMLKLPALGQTLQKIDLARFSHFFAVMFKSGIDILECLNTSQTVVVNRVLKESVATVRRFVSEGNSLTNSLRASNQFPTLVIRMFKVGEDSGNMNDALENINFFYDREVNDSVDRMVGMIQPTLTIVLGGMVLWIVSAVFGPLYDTLSKMNF